MTKEHITGHEETKPDREGSSQSHPLFKAKVNGIDSTIFLDYGSNSSWVCESRTVPSNTFTSSKPLVIKGLGQKPEATIIRVSVVNITLPNDSDLGSVCCGVVPDDLFPGHVVFGRSLFHAFGIHTKSHGNVQLLKVPGKPFLERIDTYTIFSVNENTLKAIVNP